MVHKILNIKRQLLNEHYGEGVVKYRILKHDILNMIEDYMRLQVFLCPGALEKDCFYDAIRYIGFKITNDNNGYRKIRMEFLEECRRAMDCV